ncbi:MAG: DUF4255 domain-containing protein [Myxococcota bacterium]
MSNALAIATVTQVLKSRIQRVLDDASLSAMAVDSAPSPGSDARVFIFLFAVTPDPARRNEDLPTRRTEGSLALRPVVALTLRYLIAFRSASGDRDAHRMLGLVASQLHAQPLIQGDEIDTLIAGLGLSDPLRASDLSADGVPVRFTAMSIDLDDLTRLWSSFDGVTMLPTLAYEAGPIRIEAEERPASALPVTTPLLHVRPMAIPFIERATAEAGLNEPLTVGGTLVLEGASFGGPDLRVRINDIVVTPDPADMTETLVRVPMSAVLAIDAVEAGLIAIQVGREATFDGAAPPVERPWLWSNPASILFRPSFSSAPTFGPGPASGTIEVRLPVEPALGDGQVPLLLLTPQGGGTARAHAGPWRIDGPGGDLVFTVPELASGSWLVRLQVDGVDSPVDRTGGAIAGPLLVVP